MLAVDVWATLEMQALEEEHSRQKTDTFGQSGKKLGEAWGGQNWTDSLAGGGCWDRQMESAVIS